MEVGQGPNWGCSAKEKNSQSVVKMYELSVCLFSVHLKYLKCYSKPDYKEVLLLNKSSTSRLSDLIF
jgi:hypothetical protein